MLIIKYDYSQVWKHAYIEQLKHKIIELKT